MRERCPVCNRLTFKISGGEYDIPYGGIQGKKLSPDTGYCSNCGFDYQEHINHSLEEQAKKYKRRVKIIECLRCDDKYIDCRDYIFCMVKKMKYVGRKKDYKTPKWCPNWDRQNSCREH